MGSTDSSHSFGKQYGTRRLQKQLCALKCGKFRIGENTGTGWVDTIAASIERIAGSIFELDQILAAYERSTKTLRSAQ